MPTLADKLKGKDLNRVSKKPTEPLWKGPHVDGITQSMLSRFLVCRERFRIRYIEGLEQADTFQVGLEYGNMWHECEEAHAANEDWGDKLLTYAKILLAKYRLEQPKVEKYYMLVKTQFPIYVQYWEKQKDVRERTPIYQEEVFCEDYTLPSGRTVKLRGKWDSVDYIGKGKRKQMWLQENKTKGEVVEEQLRNQLLFDMQTMIYLIALQLRGHAPVGVRYNVIRRPLSGGKHSIRQHKPTKANPQGESLIDFYKRLGDRIEEDTDYFFMRWKVQILLEDVTKFKTEFLDPQLEQLCDWYEYISSPLGLKNPFSKSNVCYPGIHWRTPYGIYNPLTRGGTTELDAYLNTGSEAGLQRVDKLFPELK